MFIDWHTVEKLIANCSLNESIKDVIWHRLYDMEAIESNEFADAEKEEIIQRLYENQLDRVTHGNYYNQTDIKNHLKKLQ